MRIGILEAGLPPAPLLPRFGSYADMIAALLGPTHDYQVFRVFEDHLPPTPASCEAYVISGSACGVYDGLAWIETLAAFVKHAAASGSRLVGICFGHQLMAQTFGGTVAKAPQGWGLGLHRYEICERASWMDDATSIEIAASHQDQVLSQPPRTTVLARNDFAPFAMLAYDDHPAISMQFHPEFNADFAQALLRCRPWHGYPAEKVAEAIASHDKPNDGARVGAWINRFLADGPGSRLSAP